MTLSVLEGSRRAPRTSVPGVHGVHSIQHHGVVTYSDLVHLLPCLQSRKVESALAENVAAPATVLVQNEEGVKTPSTAMRIHSDTAGVHVRFGEALTPFGLDEKIPALRPRKK